MSMIFCLNRDSFTLIYSNNMHIAIYSATIYFYIISSKLKIKGGTFLYMLGNVLLIIAVTISILIGSGIIVNIIPTSSPIIAPMFVISLIFVGAGASIKKKYKRPRC